MNIGGRRGGQGLMNVHPYAPNGTYSYTLPPISLLIEGTREHIMFEPQDEIDKRLRTGYDVKRSRESSTILKITHPQLGPRKLPLLIRLALYKDKKFRFPKCLTKL